MIIVKTGGKVARDQMSAEDAAHRAEAEMQRIFDRFGSDSDALIGPAISYNRIREKFDFLSSQRFAQRTGPGRGIGASIGVHGFLRP